MLIVEDLHAYYDNAHILQGVHLQVRAGEVVGLLGRNGMGKTTLVRAIAGMRPPVARQGRIAWGDRTIQHLPSYAVAKLGIGLVPQGRHIFGSLSVERNLTTTARPATDGEGWTLERVYELFPRLRERRRLRGGRLSGGEQQMLAIGRALMTNPRLLLMDEPSEGLAPIVLRDIRQRLEALKGGDLAILLVEQNLGLAMRLADRLSVLGGEGTIVWQGTPDELDADPAAKQDYLGV